MPNTGRICVLCVAGFAHPPTEICITTEEQVNAAVKDAVPIIGRPPKDGEDMADPESTGRKRAAALIPDTQMNIMLCEWALLKEAGGGIHPIKGCSGNKATDRHHGPDKNTLNNERYVNLHAICAFCHNRWHAANDITYEGERPKDSTPWVPVGEYAPHNAVDKMSRKEAVMEEFKRL